jgi:hypothetical protein
MGEGMKFIGKLITKDLDDNMWEVVVNYAFDDSKGVRHHVLKDFVTDCASIPRPLWSIVGPPRATDMAQAATLHDDKYQFGGVKRKRADQLLIEGMKVLGAPWWKRRLVYLGVRAGGWVAWKNYRKG